MKHLLLLLAVVLFAFTGIAQDEVNSNAPMIRITQGGGAGDTLTASVTKNYVVNFHTSDPLVYRVGVITDSVSGSAAYTATLQGSMDGVNFTAITAIVVSTSGDTAFFYTETTGNNWLYLRVNMVATATAQKSNVYVKWYFVRKRY